MHMRASTTLSVIPPVLIICAAYAVYRLYLRVGRRCGKCGNIFETQRHSEIYLPPDEFLISLWKSLERPIDRAAHAHDEPSEKTPPIPRWKCWKRYRWWVRRVMTVTYSYCPKCRRRILEKVNRGPISVWHLWWTKWFHPEQYTCAFRHLVDAHARASLSPKNLDKGGPSDFGDNPPVNLGLSDLWQEFLEESGSESGTPDKKKSGNTK